MREACKTDVHLPGAHNFSRERGTEVGKKRVRKEVDARKRNLFEKNEEEMLGVRLDEKDGLERRKREREMIRASMRASSVGRCTQGAINRSQTMI